MKRAAALAAAALAGGLIVAAVLLRPGANASSTTTSDLSTVPVSKRPGFPRPPRGAVVYSREMGAEALALGIVPQGARILAQASVVGPQGEGVSGLPVRFTVQGVSTNAESCGAGCYEAVLSVNGRPPSVEVEVGGSTPTHWHVSLPASWPPRDATALLARAGRVWRSLHSLSFDETLASDARHRAVSTWQVQAPDRVAYRIKGGWAGIVVGGRRWDRSPHGSRWVASAQSRLTQPIPFWVSVADAHVLGTETVQGRPALIVSFFDPATPAWFRLALDRTTLRTLDLHMVTTAHFMHDSYHSFDTTRPVTPPR